MAYDFSRAGRIPINLPLAVLAGGAVAFVIVAMPGDLFTQLVGATGLSTFIPAAEPPLGQTARLVVAGTAALLALCAVWTLLTALDKMHKPSSRSMEADAAQERLTPKLRRADTHPDAPPRPPLFAGRDLGNPFAQDDEESEPLLLDLPEDEQVEETDEQAWPFDDREAEADPAASFFDSKNERESISHLMQRLELGLLRREQRLPVADTPTPAPANEAHEPFDNRLRSAIEDLQKLASRSG